MKHKGKAIAGSNLLMILGVLCFGTLLVAATVLSGTLSTPARSVVETPMTLTAEDVLGTHENWSNSGSALVGVTYDQGLNVSSTWSGAYQITITISGARDLVASDVTVGYTLPDSTTGTIDTGANAWTVNGAANPDTLSFVLPMQTATAGVYSHYVFTITVNAAVNNVIMTFNANTA